MMTWGQCLAFHPGAQSWYHFPDAVCWHIEHCASILRSQEHCTNSVGWCQEMFVPWLQNSSELWFFHRYKIGATKSSTELLWKQQSLVSTVKIKSNWLWVEFAWKWAAPKIRFLTHFNVRNFPSSHWIFLSTWKKSRLAQSRSFMQCYDQQSAERRECARCASKLCCFWTRYCW